MNSRGTGAKGVEISIEMIKGRGKRKHYKVSIAGALTIYEAANAKTALLEALQASAELEIDLSRVTEVDTAGMQLLLMTKREAARAERKVRLAHSAASLEALDRYNLGAYFGDPVVISPQ